jgi:ABC-type antimicrobial peptide transport system permease subunit
MSITFFIGLAVVVISLLVGGVVIAATIGRMIHERDKQVPRKDDDL